MLFFGFHEGGLELFVTAYFVFVYDVLLFFDIVEILQDLGLVDRENVFEAFGELLGWAWPDEKPAVFCFLKFLGMIEHK